ncbi:uncharacterized protein CDAR_260141 [Caerostris darwini]|uniref:Uncharacterized protein n=1 Tax=Caerostris darwini TaxID=1538125 RepID=A0AAV4VBA2_9ARAC|nr:uncharacterized protein CDAR_260141 [Caerostris darwini]
MGTGCSSVQNVRSKIRRKAHQNRKSQINHLKGASKALEEVAEAREEEDELDALSPVSDAHKMGSRELSAASTVLPGTSISFSPVMEELSEFESLKPLPDLEEFPDDIRHLLFGHCSANDPNISQQLRDVYLLVLTNGTDGTRFFDEMKKTLLPSLKEFAFENEITLHAYLFGNQPVVCGHDFRQLIIDFVRELLRNELVITLTIFGRPEVHVQPPDIIQQSDFDLVVSRMSSIDCRETIHCLYSADVNAGKTCYRLQGQPKDSRDWKEKADNITHILDTAFMEEQRDNYLTSGKSFILLHDFILYS